MKYETPEFLIYSLDQNVLTTSPGDVEIKEDDPSQLWGPFF